MRKKRRTAVGRRFERVALGALMAAIAFVLERRLLKVVRRRGRPVDGGRDADLGVSSKEVDDESRG